MRSARAGDGETTVSIEFDDSRVDVGGVDDRRGGGSLPTVGGLAIGGGAGVVGIVIFLVMQLLSGPSQLPQLDGGIGSSNRPESSEQLRARCNRPGALDQSTDCRLIKVYNLADATWRDEFARRSLPYVKPGLAFYDGSTDTGCGRASAEVGPFYCPADQEIYLDLSFLDQLQQQFGATGDFAQAYILAHEFGHHLQTLLGTERQVRAAAQQQPDQAGQYSIALELQADCYAGVWATLTDRRANGIALTQDNIAEAVNAAEAVGDDRIQQKMQGRIDPETWTHGSAEQRAQWFTTGYTSADLDSCNTFQAAQLALN
jgi:predicted metalloprotease